jgi:hypothetical protein
VVRRMDQAVTARVRVGGELVPAPALPQGGVAHRRARSRPGNRTEESGRHRYIRSTQRARSGIQRGPRTPPDSEGRRPRMLSRRPEPVLEAELGLAAVTELGLAAVTELGLALGLALLKSSLRPPQSRESGTAPHILGSRLARPGILPGFRKPPRTRGSLREVCPCRYPACSSIRSILTRDRSLSSSSRGLCSAAVRCLCPADAGAQTQS